MNTCDTCKHWLPVENSDYSIEAYDLTLGSGFCREGNHHDITTDGIQFDGRDGDCTGECVTGPKFGCIHWEAK